MLNDLTIPVKGTGNIRSALLATDTQFCFICREVVFLSSFLVVTVRMGYCASSATIQRSKFWVIILSLQNKNGLRFSMMQQNKYVVISEWATVCSVL